jgi:hypothetical protein
MADADAAASVGKEERAPRRQATPSAAASRGDSGDESRDKISRPGQDKSRTQENTLFCD